MSQSQRKMITWGSVDDEEESSSNTKEAENCIELPEVQQVQMKPKEDITISGVRFQRCGGGRRVIRRGRST